MLKKLGYDLTERPFYEMVGEVLNLRRLDEAHQLVQLPLFTQPTDQRTPLHQLFYAGVAGLLGLYQCLVKEVVAPMLPGSGAVIYQQIPTLRVQFPDNVAVGEFHKDTDYGHQANEISFWLPLTPVHDSSSVHVESEPDKGDYQPCPVQPGEILAFSASTLKHGNVVNTSGKTRVSFDFRCLRESEYDPDHVGRSVNTHVAFRVGGYFARMEA